jgi:large subunit ribosomal protein L25
MRRDGQMPAVLYGPNTESILLSVNIKELEQILKKGNVGSIIFNLVIQNGKKITKPAMIKELQSHPVSGNYLHVDFYEIDMKRQINVMIPVVAKGKAKGVELGGLLQVVRRELEVLCLPGDIPQSIEIDISDLDIGEAIHVEDLKLGDNIEFAAEGNVTVVTVLSPKMEAVEEEEEAEEAEEEEEGEAGESEEPEQEG